MMTDASASASACDVRALTTVVLKGLQNSCGAIAELQVVLAGNLMLAMLCTSPEQIWCVRYGTT